MELTPMQELIKGFETMREVNFSKNNVIAHISLYLEDEKKVIIEAYEGGIRNDYIRKVKEMGFRTDKKYLNSEQYYNETFKKQDMKDKLINNIWYIKTDPHGKLIKMTTTQLHQKIQSLYDVIKSDNILIEAQNKMINELENKQIMVLFCIGFCVGALITLAVVGVLLNKK